jgi:hypothetical protein
MKFDPRVILAALVLATPTFGQATKTPATPGSNTSTGHTPAAEDDARAQQIQAATVNARAKLKEQIRGTPISRGMSVGDVIDQTHSDDELEKTVDSAQPVGGPRWADDQTCQVRVDLPGQSVTDLMSKVQKDHPADFPVKADDVKKRAATLAKTRFSSVGTAANSDAVAQARPTGGDWADVTDVERRRAFAEAHDKAVSQVLDALGPIQLNPGQTIADAMKKPAVRDRLTTWLKHQPITRLESKQDLQAAVTIFVTGKSLAAVVKSAVRDAEPDLKGADWAAVQKAVEAIPSSTTGTATAVATAPAASNLTAAGTLPPQPTEILSDLIETEATADRGSGRLLTRHTAEAAAVAKLRARFMALHISPGKTLADAAAADPSLNKAIDRAMLRARAYSVDEHTDGSVTVKVQIDPQAAWDDLRSAP